MHEIEKRKLRPGGSYDGEQRTRQTDGVEKVRKRFRGLCKMDGDDEDIDGAKLEGKVVFREKSRREEHDPLGDLVGKDETCHNEAVNFAPFFRAFTVGVGDDACRNQKNGNPEEMCRAEEGKSLSFRNRARGFPKIRHNNLDL